MECKLFLNEFCSWLPLNMHILWINIFLHCVAVLSLTGQSGAPFFACSRVHQHHQVHVPAQHVVLSLPASSPGRPCTPGRYPHSKCVRYTRQQLLAVNPAPLDPSLIPHLRELGIGFHLSSRRSCRGGRRKQHSISSNTSLPQSWPIPVCVSQAQSSRTPSRGIRHTNLTKIPLYNLKHARKLLQVGTFNAQSLGPTCKQKRSAVYDFILEHELDVLLIQETWFREHGDEGKYKELAPAGYSAKSFPRRHHGGGLAVVYKTALTNSITFTSTFPFPHSSFECVQMSLSLPQRTLHLFNIYRTHPSSKNKLKDEDFFREFPELLDLTNNSTKSASVFMGDFNFHLDRKDNLSARKFLDLLNVFDLTQSVTQTTHAKGHILDLVIHRESDKILGKKFCFSRSNI